MAHLVGVFVLGFFLTPTCVSLSFSEHKISSAANEQVSACSHLTNMFLLFLITIQYNSSNVSRVDLVSTLKLSRS